MLIAKATELFCAKLGNECVTMAQIQNRRKLLLEDVIEVCSMKERFMFLKDDLKDLAKEQLQEIKRKKRKKGNLGERMITRLLLVFSTISQKSCRIGVGVYSHCALSIIT